MVLIDGASLNSEIDCEDSKHRTPVQIANAIAQNQDGCLIANPSDQSDLSDQSDQSDQSD
jgi:hypothetical protein